MMAVPHHSSHNAGTEVTRGVDCVSRLHTQAGTNSADHEEEAERYETRRRWAVVLVGDGADEDEQYGGPEELVEEASNVGHVAQLCIIFQVRGFVSNMTYTYSIGSEHACRPRCAVKLSRYSTDPAPSFCDVDSPKVISIDDAGSDERTEDLGGNEDGYLAPWEVAERCKRNRDGWVDVTS